MALTVNKNIARGLNTMGYWVGTFFTVTGDNNYPAGGYAFAASLVKLGVIEHMPVIALYNGTNIIFAVYNNSTGKLQFFQSGAAGGGAATLLITGGQAAGPALQITPDSNLGVLGKTTAGNVTIPVTIAGLAGAGGLSEVVATTDVSAYVGYGVVWGKG